MDYTQEQFRDDIRKAVLSCRSQFHLDLSELNENEIEKIILWSEQDGFNHSIDGKTLTINVLKGFARVPQTKKKEDFLALFDGIEEDEELNQRRMKNLEELRY